MARRKRDRGVGRPVWAEIRVPDRRPAEEFYAAVLGWQFAQSAPEPEPYSLAFAGDDPVAGLWEPTPDDEPSPAAWTVFFAAADVRSSASAAESLGATLVTPVLDMMEPGRLAVVGDPRPASPYQTLGPVAEIATMCVFEDPAGAVAGLWRWRGRATDGMSGTALSLAWVEHLSERPAAAETFYRELLGWEFATADSRGAAATGPQEPDGAVVFRVEGIPYGSVAAAGEALEVEPPLWLPHFSVSDVDRAAAAATEHGGAVDTPPGDSWLGYGATLTGPSGEVFGVLGSPD